MKKQVLILLAILASVFSYSQGGFTSFSKLRLTSVPAVDTVSTQILVRNGSNGNINYVPRSFLFPDLQAVTNGIGNNITTNPIIVQETNEFFTEVVNDGNRITSRDTASGNKFWEVGASGDLTLAQYSGADPDPVQIIQFNPFGDLNQIFRVPNKPTGEYTIATTEDIGTGFETAYLNTTQSITASTDTVIDITGSAQTSNGGLDLLNLTTDAITPYNVGDVITVDVAMPFTTPAGTSNYVTLILRVKTTGQVYRAFTHPMLKGSGNADYIATSWTVPINADAQTNGLELVVNSNVNFTINEKFISVTRTHKAQ